MTGYCVVNAYKIHTVAKKMCYGRDIFILILRLNSILKLSNGVYEDSIMRLGKNKVARCNHNQISVL